MHPLNKDAALSADGASCRICGSHVRPILDLGSLPPANAFVREPNEDPGRFRLLIESCDSCANIQLHDCMSIVDLYDRYAYETPDSRMLTTHYQELGTWLTALGALTPDTFVLEVGSNVGAFLLHLKSSVRRVLGIDPARNIVAIAQAKGLETVCDFFDERSADAIRRAYGVPELIIARHCMAHNPDPHRMIAGAARLLSDAGTLVIENAYALKTLESNEFDQIYHEHMFYFTVRAMRTLLEQHDLRLTHVRMAKVHGGSVVFIARRRAAHAPIETSVPEFEAREQETLPMLLGRFAENVAQTREQLRELVARLRAEGKRVCAYGASAKGNTLLNYVGLTHREIEYCIDTTPGKQGRYLPLSGIPILSEERGFGHPPDFLLLTAWNYRDEIIARIRERVGSSIRFILPIPRVHIV